MKSSKRGILVVLIISSVAASVVWVMFFSGILLRTHGQNAANREALLQIRSGITIGASTNVVWKIFGDHCTPELKMIQDSKGRLRIEMPLEGMEEHWKLLIETESNCVKSVRIRTGDGILPSDAPGDY